MWRSGFSLSLLVLVGFTTIVQGKYMVSLTEQQVIEKAEKFVIENGYTDLPGDPHKLVGESIERSTDKNKILKSRQNTLQRKAYGVSCGTEACMVAFRFVTPVKRGEDEMWRVVTINVDGSNIRMQHKDFFLRTIKKKL